MTKNEAIMALQHKEANDVRIDYKWAEALLIQIFDEKETCEGCIFKPKNRGNYQSECGECSRWYADGYRSQNKHETGV